MASKRENPEDAVQAARNKYLEFSFSATDLREKLGKGGSKEGVKSTNPRDPVPDKDPLPMETDQEGNIIIDLREKISGKPVPPKLELSTKPKIVTKPLVTDVRLKDKKEKERNERWRKVAYTPGGVKAASDQFKKFDPCQFESHKRRQPKRCFPLWLIHIHELNSCIVT